MIIYEMKEYLMKSDENLVEKMEEFSLLGFELLSTEKTETGQKLILRRPKNLINYNKLVGLNKEIDKLEEIGLMYDNLENKREGLNEVPNIPLYVFRTYMFVSFIIFLVLSGVYYFLDDELLMYIFFGSSMFSLILFLVILFRKKSEKQVYTKNKSKVKEEINKYLEVASKIEKK